MSASSNDPDARSLVDRLCSLDEESVPREQQLLRALLVAALDPLDRRHYFGGSFTAEQLAVLERIEATSGDVDAAASEERG